MEHWSAWEATCNCKGIPGYRGKKRRSRQPRIFPEFGGKPCLGTNGQVLPVNFEREVVDCTKKDIEVFCEGQKPRALGINYYCNDCNLISFAIVSFEMLAICSPNCVQIWKGRDQKTVFCRVRHKKFRANGETFFMSSPVKICFLIVTFL